VISGILLVIFFNYFYFFNFLYKIDKKLKIFLHYNSLKYLINIIMSNNNQQIQKRQIALQKALEKAEKTEINLEEAKENLEEFERNVTLFTELHAKVSECIENDIEVSEDLLNQRLTTLLLLVKRDLDTRENSGKPVRDKKKQGEVYDLSHKDKKISSGRLESQKPKKLDSKRYKAKHSHERAPSKSENWSE
jgi:hypothetical protein